MSQTRWESMAWMGVSYGWLHLVWNLDFESFFYWRNWNFKSSAMASIWKYGAWSKGQWWWLENNIVIVTTLALGSWPKQGLARLQTKREARESHLMLPRVQNNVRDEPSHSQVNSHFESWSFNGLLNLKRAIVRVKTHWIQEFFYIIGKLLKHRCLKWAHMTTNGYWWLFY